MLNTYYLILTTMKQKTITTITVLQNLLALCFVLVVVFSISIPHTFAQLEVGLRSADITVILNPEIPAPNQDVTVTISSFSVDLNKTMVVWKKGSEVVKTGVGAKSIVVRTGAVGTAVQLDINIFSGGNSITKSVVVAPSEMDLLWETTDSYFPPFYKGKILPAKESTVKITAIPNVSGTLSPKDFVYTWEKNYVAVPSASGYGKNTLSLQLGYLQNSHTVEVTSNGISGGFPSRKILVLTPSNPYIKYYENNPDLGLLFNKSLTAAQITDRSDFEVVAMPLFFTLRNIEGSELTYTWTVGGKSVPPGGIKNRLTIQFPEGKKGSVSVTTNIENASKLFQIANGSFSITKK